MGEARPEFANTCTATFTLAPNGNGTEVTWTMVGRNNAIAKVMSLFMDMDKLVGADFEEGLKNMARVAEATPLAAPADSTAATTTPS